MRWGNAREVPAGPQGGTIAYVCIMKKRLFFFNRFHAGPFWVHLNIMKHAERRPNSTVAGKLANLVHQSPPQRFVVNVFMQMRANPNLVVWRRSRRYSTLKFISAGSNIILPLRWRCNKKLLGGLDRQIHQN